MRDAVALPGLEPAGLVERAPDTLAGRVPFTLGGLTAVPGLAIDVADVFRMATAERGGIVETEVDRPCDRFEVDLERTKGVAIVLALADAPARSTSVFRASSLVLISGAGMLVLMLRLAADCSCNGT